MDGAAFAGSGSPITKYLLTIPSTVKTIQDLSESIRSRLSLPSDASIALKVSGALVPDSEPIQLLRDGDVVVLEGPKQQKPIATSDKEATKKRARGKRGGKKHKTKSKERAASMLAKQPEPVAAKGSNESSSKKRKRGEDGANKSTSDAKKQAMTTSSASMPNNIGAKDAKKQGGAKPAQLKQRQGFIDLDSPFPHSISSTSANVGDIVRYTTLELDEATMSPLTQTRYGKIVRVNGQRFVVHSIVAQKGGPKGSNSGRITSEEVTVEWESVVEAHKQVRHAQSSLSASNDSSDNAAFAAALGSRGAYSTATHVPVGAEDGASREWNPTSPPPERAADASDGTDVIMGGVATSGSALQSGDSSAPAPDSASSSAAAAAAPAISLVTSSQPSLVPSASGDATAAAAEAERLARRKRNATAKMGVGSFLRMMGPAPK